MEHTEIRPIHNQKEFELCTQLWANVFPEDRAFFQERLDNDPAYYLETTWAAIIDGNIAASIQIFPYSTWIGSTQVKVGGIGNVATDPKYRSRGLAQSILRQQSKWMKHNGYDMSLLFTGIPSFYEQLNWQKTPEPYLIIPASSVKEKAKEPYGIEVFQKEDLDAVRRIYEYFNHGRTCTVIRSKEYWQGQLVWKHETGNQFLVAKQNGVVVAYLRSKKNNNTLEILESCYANEASEAAIVLLQYALEQANTVRTVQAKLPHDHVLYTRYEKEADIQLDHGGMWKLCHFERLMQKLTPTFVDRVTPSKIQSYDVVLRNGKKEVLVNIREEDVQVNPIIDSVIYQEEIALTEQEWAVLLTQGMELFRQIHAGKYQSNETLSILFPKQASVLWQTDHF